MLEGVKKAFTGIAEKIKTAGLSEKDVERYVEDFKLQLIANDVAVEVAEKICEALAEELRSLRFRRFSSPEKDVRRLMRRVVERILPEASPEKELLERIEEKRRRGEPFVILFVGPNGSGKTTTIVKLAHYLRERGYTPLIAAADTFRAGAIEQLRELAEKVGLRVVSQRYGADSAAVAVDAVISARANRFPVVLIDTAGRTEVDLNLLEEMRKIKRVVKPDAVIYVGDALAGNVAVEQAKRFDEYVGVDYVILAKLDADAKGGSAISISYATGKPVLFVGVGQDLESLKPFTKNLILESLLS